MQLLVKPSKPDPMPGIGVYAPSPTLTTVTVSCPHDGHVVMTEGEEGERVAVMLALAAHEALSACGCGPYIWEHRRTPDEPLDLTPFAERMRPLLAQPAVAAGEFAALFGEVLPGD